MMTTEAPHNADSAQARPTAAPHPFGDLFSANVSDVRFVAWDTETTGVVAGKDHVVEIAALAFDEDFQHRRFESLIKPPISIPKEVVAIHGIGDAEVAGAPAADVVFTQFFDFLANAGAPRVLIAHNCSFDVGMVHGEAARMAKPEALIGTGPAHELVLDTCTMAKVLLPNLERHALGYLADALKLPRAEKMHRAMADVEVLYHLFIKLIGIAADQTLARGEQLTIGALVDLSCGYHILAPGDRATRSKPFRFSQRLELLESFIGTDARVGIVYDNPEYSVRYITPLAIRTKGFRVYVEAFCHGDNMKKSFRGDRIHRVVAPS